MIRWRVLYYIVLLTQQLAVQYRREAKATSQYHYSGRATEKYMEPQDVLRIIATYYHPIIGPGCGIAH